MNRQLIYQVIYEVTTKIKGARNLSQVNIKKYRITNLFKRPILHLFVWYTFLFYKHIKAEILFNLSISEAGILNNDRTTTIKTH